jgi:hypothetical protein
VNCQLHEQKDLNHSSGLGLCLRKKLKKRTHLFLVVQFTTLTTEKTFTRYLPAQFDNCFLTLAVTADVCKQHTAAFPLLPAADIK